MYDVAIVGGGAAGLSAALVLGRARRKVVVLDAGEPRNAPSPHSHSFLTRDGAPPAELLEIGREQAEAYGVEIRAARAEDARVTEEGFEVTAAGGERVAARRLLLATGVVDELPPIPGLRERWGRSVIHCPYCHGWEVRDRPLAILAHGEGAVDLARLLRGWSSDLVVCTDGTPLGIGEADRARFERHGVRVREEPVLALEGKGDALERIVFDGGDPLSREALFVRPPQRPASALADALGCARGEAGFLVLDPLGQTSVPGVYAAGDMTQRMQQLVSAAAEGAMAAAGINRALLEEERG